MNERLRDFLDKQKVSYERKFHRTAYTAQEIAAEEHISGKRLAKSVVVKADGTFVLAVLPASYRADLDRLKGILRAKDASLASELEFSDIFPDCEVGAMPPFGNLYGLPVYCDSFLAHHPLITFNAGTHQETVQMRYRDFARLFRPKIYDFALRKESDTEFTEEEKELAISRAGDVGEFAG
jgi:Ala-tRNA(Pro) deacylase